MISYSTPTSNTASRPSTFHRWLSRTWANKGNLAIRLALILTCIVVLFPIFWAVSASFKTRSELYLSDASLIPLNPTLHNYNLLLFESTSGTTSRSELFAHWFLNSLIVTGGTVTLVVIMSSLAGYSFARMRYRGRDLIFYTVVMLLFIPRAGGLMAVYELMYFLGLRNSLLGLILLFSGNLSVPIFIMRQAFLNLPSEIEDAAQIDGCSRLQLFRHIAVPMGQAAMVFVAIERFIEIWGEYLTTLTLVDLPELYTLAVGVTIGFQAGPMMDQLDVAPYTAQAAGYLMTALPVLLVYLFLQRWFIRGLMEGLKF